ncbi:hypothetical protein PHMEG_00020108 [Phytophthora megakarya]|uniref:Uncharacterized protein n=1 Tax=Phytophthora megakarya TaxID=4795 RepID=A0A225VQ66_9STRA|nr:hypothetical protein PHMEG_00020108 [Phytophthora megakarya]
MRQSPRVHSRLDQRLDEGSSVSEVLAATIAPYRLPPHESEELIDLRDEVDRLQTRCYEAERRTNQSPRSENEDFDDRISDLNATVVRQAYVLQQLKDCYETPEADCAAPCDREGSNASLRRANSIFRRISAEHGLNTNALVLSTAGISARDINWEWLGRGADHAGFVRHLPPAADSEASDGDHRSTESSTGVRRIGIRLRLPPPGSLSLDQSFLYPALCDLEARPNLRSKLEVDCSTTLLESLDVYVGVSVSFLMRPLTAFKTPSSSKTRSSVQEARWWT